MSLPSANDTKLLSTAKTFTQDPLSAFTVKETFDLVSTGEACSNCIVTLNSYVNHIPMDNIMLLQQQNNNISTGTLFLMIKIHMRVVGD